VDDLKI